ncbi:MAG: enoyl-CoA hydratase/isomerase family protein [Gammaproteobacteria bacterium]|nr:enoyl-CoA hydratase/isomerase family protein [Gammaproteobacteria bacterium]
MNYDFLTVTNAEHVTRITLNRPDVLNAINQQMHDELQAAFDAFAGDDTQYVCVVAGAGGRAFSAGSDLKSIARTGRPHVYPQHGYAGLIERFDLDKPLIAAVDGVAVGGGFELALACDLIIATTRSRFGLPEPLVGAVALGGGMHRLARQIGQKHALRLILTGDLIGADEACQMGIITALVEPDGFDAAITDWCQRLLRCAPLSLRASKQAVMRGLDEPSLQAALKHQGEYPAFKAWLNSSDRFEGAAAFAEKRPPQWKGR